jgi:endogenous inhibitor of DNA gyrase (YacG/DUF329 family)
MRCPICAKATEARPKNPFAPFCSGRCQKVDLGNWLNETYRVPAEPHEVDEEPEEGRCVN